MKRKRTCAAFCLNCEQLRAELRAKEKQIQELQTQKTVLEYDLREMRDKWLSRRKKMKEIQEEQPQPKKRGAKKGHIGWFRAKPAKVDVIEEVTLKTCPDCGGKALRECGEIEEHIQEDIVLPQLKVTRYRRHHYWCKRCKKVVAGRGAEEIPHAYIGPKAKSIAAFLKYVIKVSQRDIQKVFAELCGLKIVPSSIPGFHTQAVQKALPLYEELKGEIKKSRYVHADETGCPMDGKNYWDWVFATVNICLHVVRQSRGQKVVAEILGQKYEGILIADFLSAYNALEAQAKQRCLVHLLRDLKKALECSLKSDPIHIYCQRLKDVIQRAIELNEQFQDQQIPQKEFETKRVEIADALQDFQFPNPHKGILNRLSKRLARHKDELFTFLYHPNIPYHNNPAERLIRPSVLLRKITFGHRSLIGIQNHSVLMSLLQTARLNGQAEIPLLHNILASQEKPSLRWCLGP